MNRVIVTKPMFGTGIQLAYTMQVCAETDATDEEILHVCNHKNMSGVTGGWSQVIRHVKKETFTLKKNMEPVTCNDHPERKHFLVLC